MTFNIPLLEKEMATHSSILAWEIPWKEEPGRLQSMGLERAGHDLATKQENIPLYRLIPSLILWLYLMNKYEINAFIQFSRPVVSDSLWPHGLQDARLPVHHQLPEFTQTHVHWVGDAIQPSHPLLSPSPPALNLKCIYWTSGMYQVLS